MRSVFTIVLGQPFVGCLRLPVAANVIAFALLLAGFWFGLLPAFEGAFTDERNPTLWGFASWLLVAPVVLELIAGPAQGGLRTIAERAMLGESVAIPPPAALMTRIRHRATAVVLVAVLMPFLLALVQIPWAGLPLTFLAGAAFAAVVWFDAPAERCGYGLAGRAEVLWRNRWRALGVGAALQLLTAVPFVNLLLLPSVAAVATTSAFVRFDKQAVGTPAAPQ